MAYINWTQDLNLGIELIDTQHRQLVDYINGLYEAKQNGDSDKTGEFLDKVVDYTIVHFTDEEKMLEKAGYHLLDTHKGVHQRFIDKITDMQKRHQNGSDTSGELLTLMENWLISHIRVNDQGYAPYIKESMKLS